MTLEKFLETRSIITKNRELPKASKWKSSAPVSPPLFALWRIEAQRMEMPALQRTLNQGQGMCLVFFALLAPRESGQPSHTVSIKDGGRLTPRHGDPELSLSCHLLTGIGRRKGKEPQVLHTYYVLCLGAY